MSVAPPRVLSIAGSDSGGGAGIQADLKTMLALGVHGMSVVVAVTAQNSVGVQGAWDLPVEAVLAQLDSVLDDIGVDAVKTGMLSSPELVAAVAGRLRAAEGSPGRPAAEPQQQPPGWPAGRPAGEPQQLPPGLPRSVPLVVDPVGVSKHGHPLLAAEAVEVLRRELVPLATVVTPNLPEVQMLTGLSVDSEADLRRGADAVLALGPRWVLVKGGHLAGEAVDLLTDGTVEHLMRAPRLDNRHTHGTGCTLASALASRLALGDDVPAAARAAKDYVTGAIRAGFALGAGIGPVDHAWQSRSPRAP